MSSKVTTPSKEKAKPAAGASLNSWTAREQELMFLAMQCLESEPKLNKEKFAEMAGFTHMGSATNAWSSLKKKLGLSAGHDGALKTPMTPKSSNRKRKSDKDASPGTDDGSVAKKAKRDGKIKVEEAVNEDDADYGDSS